MRALILLFAVFSAVAQQPRIAPWTANPAYWQMDGEPVLLLGASDDDNLFQWPADKLAAHLDLLREAGGNYVRNTMSDRKDGDWEIYPHLRRPDGKYDLEAWNPEYWERFDRFLRMTAERKIVVQIEIWDRFDSSREHWTPHSYNPANNVNYTFAESGFAPEYPEHPGQNLQPFFFTTPGQRNNTVVLRHQQRFVDKMLSSALRHGHVLYCVDNETKGEEEWSRYWARYVKRKAQEAGVRVFVTEMWDDWDVKAERHRRTTGHPELYDFADFSQNNHNKGAQHWENAIWVRQTVPDRPVNAVKTYGADGFRFGNSQDGLERFWRHLMAGFASARFHRPPAGLGLNETAQGAVRAARKIDGLVPFRSLRPDPEAPEGSEAYVSSAGGKFIVYLPKGGRVRLKAPTGTYAVHWVRADRGTERQANVRSDGALRLEAPDSANWVAAVIRHPAPTARGSVK
ncbi:MAG: hypothetical protein IPM24_19275 [Bryobacterales bacterium]|nr:hypothetical protein [Bryobacterales bacterium]